MEHIFTVSISGTGCIYPKTLSFPHIVLQGTKLGFFFVFFLVNITKHIASVYMYLYLKSLCEPANWFLLELRELTPSSDCLDVR